ncbi:MAG TPA: 16S rRNA (cytosine(967)-C(5))-methyltransferase RsmB [Candidatus Binatia bacterium]
MRESARASVSEPEFTVRESAADILTKVETRKAYADLLLERAFNAQPFPARDRALLTELVYGTLRWRGRLDAQLAGLLRRPLAESDPYVRNLLRLALYQMVFLDRIPAYAAVSESVQLVKKHGNEKTAGFVNGVLRNFLRHRPLVPVPEIKQATTAAIAEYWSHPEWLVRRWIEQFGPQETEALLGANNEAPGLVVRNNSLKQSRASLIERLRKDGIEAQATRWSPEGISLESAGVVHDIPGFDEGLFQVQGEASQLIPYLLAPTKGERILDACAAPGGKATHIAEMMNDTGEVVAIDISRTGIRKITENTKRLGLRSVRAVETDASELVDQAQFDRILVDAPCSGFGTLRSHPEIKWNRGEVDIRRLTALQGKILEKVLSYLKPGGVLVYSTCTLIEEENEGIVRSLLQRHSDVVLENASTYLPETARSLVSSNFLLALPHQHGTDGFFAARMTKFK